MARFWFSHQRCQGLAILAMMLCFQMAMAAQCNNVISLHCSTDATSYAPQHFILVHGMGGGAWFWFEIQTLLEHFNFTSTAVDLTSNGINKAIADNVTTVAQYTQPLINAISNASGPVILVGHSLGGGSIAYASEKFPHKVLKAIYLSACTPSYNQTMFGAFPNTTFPNLLNKGYLTLNGAPTPTSATLNKNALGQFYMSQTPTRYVNLAKVLVTDTPYRPGKEVLPLTRSNYGKVRRFYIRTGKDKGVLPADQDAMIAANPPEKVLCMPNGDHAVFFSAPLELFRNLLCISSL